MRLKRAVTGAAVVAASAAALAVMPAEAQAASYNGVCGGGYNVVDSMSLTGGTVFLTYNSSNGNNCVVTVRNSPGTAQPMGALVSRAGQPWISDTGNYTTYAGPVYVYARGACIDWGGYINSSSNYQYNVHCG